MKSLLSAWQHEYKSVSLTGLGDANLLDQPLTAFFASRQCPGAAIHAAMDWAVAQAKLKVPVISGFHSPLEQSALKIFLTAKSPAVVVLARNVAKAKLPEAWLEAVQEGRLAIVSTSGGQDDQPVRLTSELAHARNELVAQLAQTIVVAHASPTGKLAQQVQEWHKLQRVMKALA
jgi:predicted Rossmann fold nucleotide-binding protein DprA/Smf involved in DNA uptake